MFSAWCFGSRTRVGAPEDADDLAALEQRQVQRNFRNTRGEADDQVAAFPRQRAHGGFGIIATDGVIDHIHAVTARQLLDLVREFLLRGAV